MASVAEAKVIYDKLYTLDQTLDRRGMREFFAPFVPERLGTNFELIGLEIEVMRRRNQRCVIRYILHVFDNNSMKRLQWRIVGKVYKANRGEKTFADMRTLWNGGFHRRANDAMFIPEPLSFSTELCLLLQEEIPGKAVKEILAKSEVRPEAMRIVARTIAKLHRLNARFGEPYSVQNHLMRCHPRYPFLALACPEHEAKIDFIVETAKRVEEAFGKIALGPAHGDFHMGQLHIDHSTAYLIDFDPICHADPASDIGNLLVFQKNKARRDARMHVYIDAFLGEYYNMMGREIESRVPLYEGLTQLRRACKCLRYQDKTWHRKVDRMLNMGIANIEQVAAEYIDGFAVSKTKSMPDFRRVKAEQLS